MLKFPYGISDFYQIITENYLYVDRTDRIPVLEEAGKTLLLLRPRRFGKSLLLSMLENYYDVNKAAEFDRLFGGLAIGRQPTPLRNRYLILRWDFSDVAPHPDIHQMQQNLFDHINDRIKLFAQRYAHLFKTEIEISDENAMISFRAALRAVETTPYKLYLLIDEYDNFANEILMGGRVRNQERYESLVFSEGAFKSIFKSMKAGAAGFGVDRMMIVGVSPMVLHDVTSGFNIAKNIYNLVLHGLYATKLAELLLPEARDRDEAQSAAKVLYHQGNPQPLCTFIEQQLFPIFDNRDYIQANELTVKTAFLTLLFNDTFYVMDSEPALARTYADLTMILRPEMRRFQLLDLLLEFKFVKLSELEQSGVAVQQMDQATLLTLAPIRAKMAEAQTQLQRYRPILAKKYGDRLRLRTYAVVAIGFERLVWREV